ncbi:MAG: hypothetical protein HQL55_02610 [Magnetococcales bacterium]|nr:hypothetical protein [Magnetococcales bacterium]
MQESKVHGSVVAILFRDSDGTHSSPSRQYQDKLDSIKNGFHDAQCEYGVAMLAKPTSEAWLLCALKNQYQGCARLEELPGNRESDRHPKKLLAEVLQNRTSAEELCELVQQGKLDGNRIDMPSFNQFRDDFYQVLEQLQKGETCHGES